ncbi:hypothetical protein J6590_085348 [Homalodisca vitripennis]|nr:hypothetical protein J6590_085348 [Homalodisca vitripennis]
MKRVDTRVRLGSVHNLSRRTDNSYLSETKSNLDDRGLLETLVHVSSRSVPVQFQVSSSSVPGQFQFSSSSVPGQFQFSSSSVPGQFQVSSSSVPGQFQVSSSSVPGQFQVSSRSVRFGPSHRADRGAYRMTDRLKLKLV